MPRLRRQGQRETVCRPEWLAPRGTISEVFGAPSVLMTPERPSLDRVNLTQKGDVSPMMWIWGRRTGLIVAAPCPLGSGVRPVRIVRSNVNRCHLVFANWSWAGEASPMHAKTRSAWPLFGECSRHDTRACNQPLPRIRDSLRSSTVATRYSTSALQAAIDHLRALGSRRDEIKVL